jgi:bacteriorhodopsin
MGNRALDINPDTNSQGHADIAITRRGSDWYFTVAAVMGFCTLLLWGFSMKRKLSQRLFYYLAAAICLVSGIAYFTEGSNLGWTPITVEFQRSNSKVHGTFRQIFYVRYIDYFITTPLILLSLFLSASMPWPTILYTILIDWVMVVSWLVGTLVKSTYKWGYFAFGTVAYLFIAYSLLFPARQHAASLGGSIYRTYLRCGTAIVFLWLLYPIAWGCSEGGNVIAPDSEAIFYGIIDLLSKPVFCFLLLWGHHDLGMWT